MGGGSAQSGPLARPIVLQFSRTPRVYLSQAHVGHARGPRLPDADSWQRDERDGRQVRHSCAECKGLTSAI